MFLKTEWEAEKARVRTEMAPQEVEFPTEKPAEPTLEFWVLMLVVGLLGFLTVWGAGAHTW